MQPAPRDAPIVDDPLRVLFVNKYLYPKGGAETHLLEVADALARRGHDLRYVGTDLGTPQTSAALTTTAPAPDYNRLDGWWDRLGALGGMIYSLPARDAIHRVLRRFPADVAHLHNVYHQLSPSVVVALKRAGVPVVLTAHDFKLVCPSYLLHDGESTCFACRGHRYWNVVGQGCSRRGFAGGLAMMVESTIHHFLRLYEQHLDLVIAPSRFVRDRLVEGGFSPRRVCVLPNAVQVDRFRPQTKLGDYLLYVGRLSSEKGLSTLLSAASQVPEIPFWIVGDGPERAELERQAADLPHVRFLGFRPPAEVARLLQNCRATVLASHWPENCPMSILEAFACAKPVVATRVGGVPELFEGALAELLVPLGDASALADVVRRLWSDPQACRYLGTLARRQAEDRHNLPDYIDELEQIYASLAGRPESRRFTALGRHGAMLGSGT